MRYSLLLALLCVLFHQPSAFAEPLRLDLSLAERLLVRNRDILAAQRAVDNAQAGVTIAGQAPNPTVSYSASNISPNLGVGSGSLGDKRIDQTLGIEQVVERGGKRALRKGGAEAMLSAAGADLADTRRKQHLLLHQSFHDLKAAQEKVRLMTESAELYAKSLAAAERRLQVGDIAVVDANRQRVELLRAQNDMRAAEGDLARARHSLAYLIGLTDRVDDIVADGDWPARILPPSGDMALERRPDVRAARARIEAASNGRELARSQTTRDVTLGAQVARTLGYSSYQPGVNYGFTISVPLFVRYAYEGEIAQAETAYTAALEAAETTLIQARHEVEQARANLAAASDRWHRSEEESLPEARRVAEATEFAYRKGALGLTDLLDARRTLRALELEALATRTDYAKAYSAWLAATEWETAER